MKGRKTKLSKQTSQIICDCIRQGFTHEVASIRAGIVRSSMYKWLAKGRDAKRGMHADFYRAFRDATGQFEALATKSIRNAMLGGYFEVPMFDVDGNLVPETDPASGEMLHDGNGRPRFRTKWTYQKPDHAFAVKVLAKRNPKDWGDGPKTSLDEELDRITTKKAPELPSHKTIGIPLLTKAVQILVDQGVDIDVPDAQLDKLVARQLERRRMAALPAPSVEAANDCNRPESNTRSAGLLAPVDAKDESKRGDLPDEQLEEGSARDLQPQPMAALAAPSIEAAENGSHPGSGFSSAGLPLPDDVKDESRRGEAKLE